MISILYLFLFRSFSVDQERKTKIKFNRNCVCKSNNISSRYLSVVVIVCRQFTRFLFFLYTCTMIYATVFLVFISVWVLFHCKKKIHLNRLFDWPHYKTALEMSSLKFSTLIQSLVNIHIENALKQKMKTITLVNFCIVVSVGTHSEHWVGSPYATICICMCAPCNASAMTSSRCESTTTNCN